MDVDIDSVIETVNDIDSHPEKLLRPQKKDAQMQKALQSMYLFTMQYDTDKKLDILPELVLEGMDQEQIWQQLELRNSYVIDHYLSQVAGVAALHERKLSIQVENKNEANNENTEESEDTAHVVVAKTSEKIKKPKTNGVGKKANKKSDGDRFFDLDEMNKFLDMEDAKSNMKDRDDTMQIDYFQDIEEDENDLKYGDFYDNGGDENASADDMADEEEDEDGDDGDDDDDGEEEDDGEGVDDDDNDDDDGEEEEDDDGGNEKADAKDVKEKLVDGNQSELSENQKSSFEERQDRRQQQISVHESQMLDDKPWQLKGEILAGGRPQNSLLEEILEFESTVRPAPVITEETTLKLEDIIRQRIKDQAWDDVEVKQRDKIVPPEYRKQITLDQEKSKMSLSKIYEMEYQSESNKQNKHVESVERNPVTEKIERNMNNLLDTLNSLFHFYFTPTLVLPEPQIVTNMPALQMEDVLPVAVSDATLLAPEEVFKGNKKSLLGKSERTTTDKKRERRKKKLKQHAIMKRTTLKQANNPKILDRSKKLKLPTKISKSVEMINRDDVKQPKSSKQFFARMQENSTTSENKKVIKHKIQRAKDVKL